MAETFFKKIRARKLTYDFCKFLLILLSVIIVDCQNKAENHYKKGEEYLHSERYDDALKEFEEAVKQNPKYLKAFYLLGWTHYMMGNNDEALNNFKKCVSLDSEDYRGYKGSASIFLRQGNYDLAIENYKKAVSLNPEIAALYENIAWVYVALEDYNQAIESAKKAIELQPNEGENYFILGKAYLLKREYENARVYFEKGLLLGFKGKKFKHYILADLSIVYAITGNKEAALGKISEAIQLAPEIHEYAKIYYAIKSKASVETMRSIIW
ncbi:tetratricopeptide repeat protein [candidate division WOR-3 bacterium]|nr:tetratricopeptide repeat protein [candidate division WOR-3 bacterium]